MGRNPVAERMIPAPPESGSKGPKTGLPSGGADPSMANPPEKLASVPRSSGATRWQTVHDTPSAANAAYSPSFSAGRLAKTRPLRPSFSATALAIGMWQRAHWASISAAASGWSMTSRRTAACQ